MLAEFVATAFLHGTEKVLNIFPTLYAGQSVASFVTLVYFARKHGGRP